MWSKAEVASSRRNSIWEAVREWSEKGRSVECCFMWQLCEKLKTLACHDQTKESPERLNFLLTCTLSPSSCSVQFFFFFSIVQQTSQFVALFSWSTNGKNCSAGIKAFFSLSELFLFFHFFLLLNSVQFFLLHSASCVTYAYASHTWCKQRAVTCVRKAFVFHRITSGTAKSTQQHTKWCNLSKFAENERVQLLVSDALNCKCPFNCKILTLNNSLKCIFWANRFANNRHTNFDKIVQRFQRTTHARAHATILLPKHIQSMDLVYAQRF